MGAKIYKLEKDKMKKKGKYSEKRTGEKLLDPGLKNAIKEKIMDGSMPCAVAFIVSENMNVLPQEVGYAVDMMDIPISKCQLGLFGNLPFGKIVQRADSITPELEAAIRESLVDGRLSCSSSWEIAKRFFVTKMKVSSVCEALGIKISACQLGAF